MRRLAFITAVAAVSTAFSGVAQAGQSETTTDVATVETKATVGSKTASGKAQTVMLNGKEYQVCGGDVTDNCINPREAGLNFGNRALDYWPGKPASEM